MKSARLQGVSEVRVFGQRDYSMRIWLDPDKLAARNVAVSDIVSAVREQNAEVALGQLGQQPTAENSVVNPNINSVNILTTGGSERNLPTPSLAPMKRSTASRLLNMPGNFRCMFRDACRRQKNLATSSCEQLPMVARCGFVDLGRVEVAARTIETNNRFNQKPTVGLAIFQLPDANALETADLIKSKMDELAVDFPGRSDLGSGLRHDSVYS
jgi:multidrug efflux pump